MDVDSAIVARYAEYAYDGTLNLIGAGSSGFYSVPLRPPQPQPNGQLAVGMPVYVFVGIRITYERADLASQHSVQVAVMDALATTVFDSGPLPLELRDDPSMPPGTALALAIPFTCSFAPSAFGLHTAKIALDAALRKSLTFFVVQPPQAGTQ